MQPVILHQDRVGQQRYEATQQQGLGFQAQLHLLQAEATHQAADAVLGQEIGGQAHQHRAGQLQQQEIQEAGELTGGAHAMERMEEDQRRGQGIEEEQTPVITAEACEAAVQVGGGIATVRMLIGPAHQRQQEMPEVATGPNQHGNQKQRQGTVPHHLPELLCVGQAEQLRPHQTDHRGQGEAHQHQCGETCSSACGFLLHRSLWTLLVQTRPGAWCR